MFCAQMVGKPVTAPDPMAAPAVVSPIDVRKFAAAEMRLACG